MSNIPRLFFNSTQRGVPGYSPQPWYVGHVPQTPELPYFYEKLVTYVTRAVKINALTYPWSANQHSVLDPPSLYSSFHGVVE